MPGPLDGFQNCEAGYKFKTFNCIFTCFTAFSTNKEVSQGHSYYTKAMKL